AVSAPVSPRLTCVGPVLERLEDVLPTDDRDRLHARVLEELGYRVANDTVTLVFEPLHFHEIALRVAKAAELGERLRQVLDGGNEHATLLERLRHRLVDLVEPEQVRGMLDVVDDVVDLLCGLVDVLAVERGDVLGVEQLDDLPREVVALGLQPLHFHLLDLRLRPSAEARLRQARSLERVLPGGREEVVELGGPWDERQLHLPFLPAMCLETNRAGGRRPTLLLCAKRR